MVACFINRTVSHDVSRPFHQRLDATGWILREASQIIHYIRLGYVVHQ
jgi:hypothetical protein